MKYWIHGVPLILLGTQMLTACAGVPRFRDRPVVWRVADTEDIPEPEEREFLPKATYADLFLLRRLTRALELRDREPAWNTNALDEVPNSTWFTNRIGAQRMTLQDAARGAGPATPPRVPLTVVGGKGGGANPGFIVKDARGDRFIVKFDTRENPEMQTATSVIVNRLFWLAGYNVPDDTVFFFERKDLLIDPKATFTNELKQAIPVTEELLQEQLVTATRRPDGRYRASASRLLQGIPKGGFSAEGVRADDINDVVPHEHRRELRGLRVLAAWLGHTDIKEDNTLDMYVEENGQRFLRHFLVDFGEALGAHQAEKRRYEDGWEHVWDWQHQPLAALSFGLWKRPWEDQEETPWPSIGAFGAEHFDPALWREVYPYWPFFEADAADLYWGAKIVMRFTRPFLETAVAQGQFSNAEAAAYLVDALLERRRAIGRTWLEAVTALDYFRMEKDNKLCGLDLGVHYNLKTMGLVEWLPSDYEPDVHDGQKEHEARLQTFPVDHQGRVCMPVKHANDYSVIRLRLRRGVERKPVMQVHLLGGTAPRILGIIRVEP